MKEFIKNEKVLGLLRKAIQEKTITYEEINRELKDELPVDKIEYLIEGMIDQGIDIVKEEDLKKMLKKNLTIKSMKNFQKNHLWMKMKMILETLMT